MTLETCLPFAKGIYSKKVSFRGSSVGVYTKRQRSPIFQVENVYVCRCIYMFTPDSYLHMIDTVDGRDSDV